MYYLKQMHFKYKDIEVESEKMKMVYHANIKHKKLVLVYYHKTEQTLRKERKRGSFHDSKKINSRRYKYLKCACTY